MSLFKDLELLKKQVSSLMEENRLKLKPLYDSFITLRQATLDGWAGTKQDDLTMIRNDNTHGGSILADVEVIRRQSRLYIFGPSRVDIWKDVFERMYGISYETVEGVIESVPAKLRTVLDIAASTRVLFTWQCEDNRPRRDKILGNCEMVIGIWKRGSEDLFRRVL